MNRIRFRAPFAVLAGLSLLAAACAAGVRGDDHSMSGAAASNSFGLDLYRVLSSSTSGGNIFISPLSISLALTMTENGATGETAEEMARVLGHEGLALDEINQSYAGLMAELEGEIDQVLLDIANSLWARRGLEFKRSFLERTRTSFGAEFRTLDFSEPSARDEINGWVSDKTNGMIDELVDSIPQDAILYLINAIYFKGAWQEAFDPDQTRETDFSLSAERTKKVMMMHRSDQFRYLDGEGFDAVAIPYGDGRISIYLFLPERGSDLSAFHSSLDSKRWEGWMKSFIKRRGTVGLPRFKARYRSLLNEPLAALGMVRAFSDDKAQFGDMIESPIGNASISRVIHEAVIEVNEEGTEAAAATSVEIKLTSVRIEQEPFSLICDRPFFFAIRDDQTGALLFMGSISDPE